MLVKHLLRLSNRKTEHIFNTFWVTNRAEETTGKFYLKNKEYFKENAKFAEKKEEQFEKERC